MIVLKADPNLSPGQASLPRDIMEHVIPSPTITLTLGMNQVLVVPVSTTSGSLFLSTRDLEHLGVPSGFTWRSQLKKNAAEMVLGPYLGIITTRPAEPKPGQPFGNRTGSYQEISRLSRQNGGLIAVFTPEQLTGFPRTASCQVYRDSWSPYRLPLPRVFYNRIPTRKLESTYKYLLAGLEARGHVVFNSRFINKPEIYQALQSDPVLSPFLPRTVFFSPESLDHFLNARKPFFLKPTSSALGEGIIKVDYSDQQWCCLRQNKNRLAKHPTRNLGEIKKQLLTLCGHRSYLLQEAVPLAGNQGRVFDLRCLVQKDGQGHWTLVGLGARVSAPGLYLTHVPNGGEVWSAQKALAWSIGSDKEPENLETLLTEAATTLEEKLGIHLAVLTADVGLDHRGHPYILEMNSKPWRFDEPSIRFSSHELLLDYAFYLEGITG